MTRSADTDNLAMSQERLKSTSSTDEDCQPAISISIALLFLVCKLGLLRLCAPPTYHRNRPPLPNGISRKTHMLQDVSAAWQALYFEFV